MEWYNSLTDTQKYALVGGVIALVVGLIVLIVVLTSHHGLEKIGTNGQDPSKSWDPLYKNCRAGKTGCNVYGFSPGNDGVGCAGFCKRFSDSKGQEYGTYSGNDLALGIPKSTQTTDQFCNRGVDNIGKEQNCYCAPQSMQSSLLNFTLASDCSA